MNKITIIVIAGFVLLAGIFFYNTGKSSLISPRDSEGGVLEVVENNFNFGEILIDGGLMRRNFTVRNTGDELVKIQNISTSCACTIANIYNEAGEKQGPFGMVGPAHKPNPKIAMEILPGEEIVVEAVYDPLAHGPDATGRIMREIFLSTNTNANLSLKFMGDVVKQFSKTTGPSLEFNNTEYDYGIVRQSQGIVETTFEVVNNGTETVIVDSLPTSCACTEASIDKKEIATGEKATITVAFDANLHAEPEGRFFKTIEVISNINPSPQLKIYVNMDYDLGVEQLKSQEHNEANE